MSQEIITQLLVKNLNTDDVTWALSFQQSALEAGFKVSDSTYTISHIKLFIGDVITPEMIADNALNIYFCAAIEGLEEERRSIGLTDVTLLASSQELSKAARYFPEYDSSKYLVNGFPVQVSKIKKMASDWSEKKPKSVCFLGETRPEKNPEFELRLILELTQQGYRCAHLSPAAISISDKLQDLGCEVVENIRGAKYLAKADEFQFAINTSHRESLFISGIEAHALGAVPIMPNMPTSGYFDWCPEELMYEPDNIGQVIQLISELSESNRPQLNIDWYDEQQYFSRLKSLYREIRCQN
jgi:hypothetical protein